MTELNWTKQIVHAPFGASKKSRTMWQCQHDGDVWTLRPGAKGLDSCENWIVERYSHGIRTRFATMPTLQSAADVVVRFVNDH